MIILIFISKNIVNKDRAQSPSKESKSQISDAKGAAKAKQQTKDKPDKKKGDKAAASRPTSSGFDISKPHWTLKWVSDSANADSIEIRKDTDRVEEIKALKRAWESQDRGRAARAINAREKFLKSNLVKVEGANDDELDLSLIHISQGIVR